MLIHLILILATPATWQTPIEVLPYEKHRAIPRMTAWPYPSGFT